MGRKHPHRRCRHDDPAAWRALCRRPAPVTGVAARPAILHAACVSLEGRGVLVLGPSGSGKSALALQLMAHGCTLVSDDAVEVRDDDGAPVARAP
ncbi:MAG: hypothetical protein KDE06_10360, partial [Rhodobacteraceae bacterium]|nr:hypothetical protein [Paracoccaceae bacterium]